VSLFLLSPESEDRNEVEVATGRSTKRPTLNDTHIYYFIFKRIKKKKEVSIGRELIYLFFFSCSYNFHSRGSSSVHLKLIRD
jgi:hypothetical protein